MLKEVFAKYPVAEGLAPNGQVLRYKVYQYRTFVQIQNCKLWSLQERLQLPRLCLIRPHAYLHSEHLVDLVALFWRQAIKGLRNEYPRREILGNSETGSHLCRDGDRQPQR